MGAEIFIFKTSVHTAADVQLVAMLFGSVEAIKQWSFDLEDCDKILRIVALGIRPGAVEQLLLKAGFACEHMAYELQ
ncbi:hypothetical protein [Parapedobacter sp. 10938]|uniref:hypothetical protein n=1 Tax=Parapedobacter flavus TaxID=3110225 RepID=UPI002DBB7136|nr:hypothetical protein [Parapedobacter sp. 10938]MEC3880901.1 hypothetical protein [Parapedobacter sp. 10938]